MDFFPSFFFLFFFERTGNMIIELGFQNAVLISHSNNLEVILFQDILRKNEKRKVQNYVCNLVFTP